MFSVTRTKMVWFTLSGCFFAISIAAMIVWGFKYGIDFTGGSLLEEQFAVRRPDTAVIQQVVARSVPDEIQAQAVGDTGVIIKMKFIDEATHQKIVSALTALPDGKNMIEKRFETIGPTVSSELKSRAEWSIVAVLVAIIVYIAWAFRQVSHPLPSWKFGVVAVLALMHDVFIPAGAFAILGHFKGYEVDTLFVTALLTILGFSVHDTIVAFDRVREHLKRTPKAAFEDLVDRSVRETMRRSINTSLTVLIVLIPVYFFSAESIKHFTLTLILGVIFGTYSSIFIACPLLVVWNRIAKSK